MVLINPSSNRLGRLLKAIFSVALIIIVTLAGFELIKAFTGTSSPICVVVSPSMSPALNKGDLVIVFKALIEDLEVGDVIVFHKPTNPSELIVHRVYKILTDSDGRRYVVTKGDANVNPDNWRVYDELIVGKVVYVIPSIGWISIILKPPINYFFIAVIIVLLIISEFRDRRVE